jgi:hypothetical protein
MGIGTRPIWGARHPERNFASSLDVRSPLTYLLELSVRNEQLHEAVVIGVYLLQSWLHKHAGWFHCCSAVVCLLAHIADLDAPLKLNSVRQRTDTTLHPKSNRIVYKQRRSTLLLAADSLERFFLIAFIVYFVRRA